MANRKVTQPEIQVQIFRHKGRYFLSVSICKNTSKGDRKDRLDTGCSVLQRRVDLNPGDSRQQL